MKKTTYLPGIALFVVMFLCAGLVSLKSWDGVVYVYLDDTRSPAAIGRNLDFSHLDGSDLLLATQRRLVSDARILLQDQAVGLELGNFVTKDSEGHKVLACRAYDRVRVEFWAEGTAESGQVPKMFVESLCREGKDISRISPIWIPVSQITSQTPGDLELQSWENEPVGVKLTGMGSQWPKKWNLVSVKLFKKDSDAQGIFIGPEDVKELRDQKPLQLTF
jgi:hypothetical protein